MKKENIFPKRKSPRLKEFDYSQLYIYFLTICTIEKKNIFQNNSLNQEIIHCLLEEKTNSGIRLLCYCLMPNHLHLLAQPKNADANISKFIAAFKRKTYKIFHNYGIEGKIWQSSFYDHIVRKREALSEIMKYILNNPVRKGLVEKWDEYPHSGYVDNSE
jgi:putative transposase